MGKKTIKAEEIISESGFLDFVGEIRGATGVQFQSQWTNLSVTDINYSLGRVGIGANPVDASLHVEGNVYATSNLEIGLANLFVDTQTSKVGILTRTPQATVHVEGNVYTSSNLEVGVANLFVDTQTSKVGIGTNTPLYKLDVHGTANVGVLTTTSVSGDGSGLTNIPSSAVIGGSDIWITAGNNISYTAGNVGILTASPTTALDVNGTVTATNFSGPLTGVATNATNAVNASNVNITVQTLLPATRRVIFGPNETLTGNRGLFSDDQLLYTGSTGTLQSTRFSGDGAGLTNLTRTNMPDLVATRVKLGLEAGQNAQAVHGVAVGSQAGKTTQGEAAVAVGYNAGLTTQGANAVALGANAGLTSQAANSIVINATGVAVNNTTTNSCVIQPIRGGNITASALAYTSAGELVEETNVHFDTNGRVGIGKTNPGTALDVVGTVTATAVSGTHLGPISGSNTANFSTITVSGGLVTNTGGVTKKTYSYKASITAGTKPDIALVFTNHSFSAKITAHLIESDVEMSALTLDVSGGRLGGATPSNLNIAKGALSVFGDTTSNPWSSGVTTTATTVTLTPTSNLNGTGEYRIFVEYVSGDTGGALSSIAGVTMGY